MTLAAGKACAESRQRAGGIMGTDVCMSCVVSLGAVVANLNVVASRALIECRCATGVCPTCREGGLCCGKFPAPCPTYTSCPITLKPLPIPRD